MEKKIQFAYGLHTINGISMVLAVVVMGLCLWLRYEWDYKHYIFEIEAEKVLWTGPYILMASSIIAMVTIVVGIRATIIESPRLLLIFALGCAISAILGLAGAIYSLNYGIFRSELTPWLEERFFEIFHQMDYNERSARTMRILQEGFECCGPTDWTDYLLFNKVIPSECRNPDTGNMSGGCAEEFALWVEPRTGWVSGIALLLVAIQLVAISVSLCLHRMILKERTKNKPYHQVGRNTKI